MISSSNYSNKTKVDIFIENRKVIVSYSILEEFTREEFETIEDALIAVSRNSSLDSYLREDILDQAKFLSNMIVYENYGV